MVNGLHRAHGILGLRIWNAHDATLQRILYGPGEIWSVHISPVGNYLAIEGAYGRVTTWNYAELECLHVYCGVHSSSAIIRPLPL